VMFANIGSLNNALTSVFSVGSMPLRLSQARTSDSTGAIVAVIETCTNHAGDRAAQQTSQMGRLLVVGVRYPGIAAPISAGVAFGECALQNNPRCLNSEPRRYRR
jgi:hypothetical protein